MRRFDQPPHRGRKYRERPGIYAIVHDGERALLIDQPDLGPEIQLPGGGIDPGETELRALHREVLEETGWTIRPMRRLGIYQRYAYMPEYDLWARKLCRIYLCRPGLRISPPREPGHRAFWMPLAAAVAALAYEGDRWFMSRTLRR